MSGELPAPETRYEGDWLRVVRRGKWEYAERTHGEGMAVIIVAVTPGDGLLFVEQFRVPTGSRTIELPAGQTVELKPGGYHVMLLDLKAPLEKGSTVPMTLVFQDAQGAESALQLVLTVATTAPGGAPSGGMAHGHKH